MWINDRPILRRPYRTIHPSYTTFDDIVSPPEREFQLSKTTKKTKQLGDAVPAGSWNGESLLGRDQSRATTRVEESSPAPETEDRGTGDSFFRLRIWNSNSALVALRRLLECSASSLEFDSPGSGNSDVQVTNGDERERILKKRFYSK